VQPWPIPAAIPAVPDFLDDAAKAEWVRLAGELHKLGRLTALDVAVFAAYCSAYGHLVELQQQLSRKQLTAAARAQLTKMARAASRDVLRYGAEFGLSPQSRRRFADVPAAPPDPLDKFLGTA